jgi:hypothetical protein
MNALDQESDFSYGLRIGRYLALLDSQYTTQSNRYTIVVYDETHKMLKVFTGESRMRDCQEYLVKRLDELEIERKISSSKWTRESILKSEEIFSEATELGKEEVAASQDFPYPFVADPREWRFGVDPAALGTDETKWSVIDPSGDIGLPYIKVLEKKA